MGCIKGINAAQKGVNAPQLIVVFNLNLLRFLTFRHTGYHDDGLAFRNHKSKRTA